MPGIAWLRGGLLGMTTALVLLSGTTARATETVCVSVDERSWSKPQDDGASGEGDAGSDGDDTPRPGATRLPLDRQPLAQLLTPDSAAEEDGTEASQGDTRPSAPEHDSARAAATSKVDPDDEGASLLRRRGGPILLAEPPNPHEIDPTQQLKRLVEYEVTHEAGFEAVQTGCAQHLIVELYPLEDGWTVFGRYSGHAREEKVAKVEADEFAALAQRLTRALLRDQTIETTITRGNVLRADSEGQLQRIGVQGYALFALGTSLRLGWLDTATEVDQRAQRELRLLTPVSAQLGYRGKFRAWGVDAFGRAHVGTHESSVPENPLGGHTDYAGGGGVGLHFLHFARPERMSSLYFGGGASFEVSVFSIIRQPERRGPDRDTLLAGGLDLSGVLGYEFMRASALHFMTQLEVHAPAYAVHIENRSGAINTYLPGATALIGAAF